MERIELTIGHSPDPDDAFMWWPLGSTEPAQPAEPSIDTGRFSFRPVALDIEALNRRALERGDLDISAVSFRTAALAWDRYAITACGASIGDGYGPKLVSPSGGALGAGARVALPGAGTTAFLLTSLMLGGRFEPVFMPFERVVEAVRAGDVDAGVVIHEAQLTFADAGLSLIADLGAWWHERTGLPTPLGANAIRLDLEERFGRGTLEEVTGLLTASIEQALRSREHGVDHALAFAQPGTSREQADAFIAMYVNERTIAMDERAERGFARLVEEGRAAGLLPAGSPVRIVRP